MKKERPIKLRSKLAQQFHNNSTIEGIIKSWDYQKKIDYIACTAKPTETEKGKIYITFVVPSRTYMISVIDAGFEFELNGPLETKILILREQPRENIIDLTLKIEMNMDELKRATSKRFPNYGKLCYDKIMELYKGLL